jgi:hypothetical protein
MNQQEQYYKEMYLNVLTSGIRKLQLMSFVGFGYSTINNKADGINSRLNDIREEMIKKDLSTDCLSTFPVLQRRDELTKLQVNNDLIALRWFN